MASIVYQTDKKTGAKYAYESISYWDKEKKQPRSKRRYIGRVDPETGEIIRKGEGINSAQQKQIDTSLQEELEQKDNEIAMLKKELAALTRKYDIAIDTLKKIEKLARVNLEA